VSNVRKMMQMAAAAVGHSIPFIGTEHGLPSGQIGELDEALGNVRTTIILLGEGSNSTSPSMSRISGLAVRARRAYLWLLLESDPKIIYGTDKIGPKPAVPSYAAMTFILDGTSSARCAFEPEWHADGLPLPT